MPPDHPDAYLRQWRLARLVEESGPPGTVLNAGDRTFALASYLPDWQVITADVHRPPRAGYPPSPDVHRPPRAGYPPSPAGRQPPFVQASPAARRPPFVQADLTMAPLADGAVDVVVSTDVLEHLPAGRRASFLAEAVRVARRQVFIAFPAGPEAAVAEALILRSKSRRNFRAALQEHARFGLPQLGEVEAALAGLRGAHTITPLTTVAEWLTSFVFDEGDREDYGLLEDYCRLLNGTAAPIPGPGAVYRWLVVIDLTANTRMSSVAACGR
ncbi:MAG: methyltransferase domain-containing protein [Acidimicrobiales bacterium]